MVSVVIVVSVVISMHPYPAWSHTVDEVVTHHRTNLKNGLSEPEVEARLAQCRAAGFTSQPFSDWH